MAEKIKISDDNMIRRAFRRSPIWCNLALMALAVIVAVWLLLTFVDLWTHHGATSVVPDVRGLSYEDAVAVLDEANLDVVIADSIDNNGRDMVGGTVVEVVPKAGAVVKRGREVYLTIVSYGAHQVKIGEPLANRDLRSVMTVLYNLGIDTSRVVIKKVPWIYPGSVIAVHTGDRTIDMGSTVAVNAPITIELGVDGELLDAETALTPDTLVAEPAPVVIDGVEYDSPQSVPDEPAETPRKPETPAQPAQPSNTLYD